MKKKIMLLVAINLLILQLSATETSAPEVAAKHAISLYGTPKYTAEFTNFDYVNPNAIKGGSIKHGVVGSFDSIMPFNNKGMVAAGLDLTYDSLLARSWDEPLTKYGLVAEKIKLDPNNLWVEFYINPKARFHDGSAITAVDVKYSFDTLTNKGSTFYKNFYRDIAEVKLIDDMTVLFTFKTNSNKELALILGQMPIFSKKYWENHNFESPKLEIPVTSGPYKISNFAIGKTITYERVADYWAKDLAVNKGRHNFDTITYNYYLSSTVMSESVKRGDIDFQVINDPKDWHAYLNNNNLSKVKLKCTTLANKNPQTVTLTFNQRRSYLKQKAVRQAIGYAIDFDWLNTNLFYNIYQHAQSIYAGTDFAATDIPDLNEQQILKPWQNKLPEALFTEKWHNPTQVKSIRDRRTLAIKILTDAGWKVKNHQLVDANNKVLKLEFLTANAYHERIIGPIKTELGKLGINLTIKTVDISQYIEALRNHDFDIILHTYPHTPSPGTEQANFWSSSWCERKGSKNVTGVKLDVVDELLKLVDTAESRSQLVDTIKAIDRILLWDYTVLPLWYQPNYLIIHKEFLQYPQFPAPYVLDLSTWWHGIP